MPFNGRLLVGLNGREPGPNLIRYARMVRRLNPAQFESERIERGAMGCGVVKGRVMERFPAFAADFDSDLLLLEDATVSRSHCGHLAMRAPCSVWFVPPAWAPVLRRILVPIDFSRCSAIGLQVATELASRFPQAKCLPLHVYHHEGRFRHDAADRWRRRQMAHEFDAFVAGIDTHDVPLEPLFVESHSISRAIDLTADEQGVDLIVMATRGRSRLTRWMFRGVTEAAIRERRASFLVLKSPESLSFWSALREQLARPDTLQFS